MEQKKETYQLKEVRIRLEEGKGFYSDRKITSAQDAVMVMQRELSTYDREVVCIVNLTTTNRPICFNLVSVGNINSSIVDIMNLLKSCILTNAASFIMLHNHPSGDVSSPSREDIEVTGRVILAGALFGIPCIDHVIIAGGGKEYYSMREHGDADFSPGYEKVMEGAGSMVAEMNESYGNPFDDVDPDEIMQAMENAKGNGKKEEVTLHFGKGLCDFFTTKKGAEMARIKLPDTPFESWPSFVVPARIVHENQFGKGLWMKLPADGKTTLTIPRKVTGEDGQEKWQDKKMTVDNVRLKEMVESYKKKDRGEDRPPGESLERLAGHKSR